MRTKIFRIDTVALTHIKTLPPILLIEAKGVTNTEGWTNVRLEPYIYIMPPADGIYEFDFVADPLKK